MCSFAVAPFCLDKYGNVLARIDHDIGRLTMSMIMHREVEGLFR